MIPGHQIYESLLGHRWASLAAPIQSAHAIGRERRGLFRVFHGPHPLAHRLVRWSGLPPASDATAIRLRISTKANRQRWERHFAGHSFVTEQHGKQGRLLERFGPWELAFELQVDDDSLVYRQCAARLCLGPIFVPVPLCLAPRVEARESADGPHRVRILVTVTAPGIGLLIRYEGFLDVGETSA